jgi:GTP cyclohydrolase I
MGGYPVAIEISKYSGIPIDNKITPQSLIVDDLIDSGKTLSRFTNDKAVLIVKNNRESEVTYYADKINEWVQFSWEGETTVDANITRIIQFIGDNPTREGLIETPARVRKSYDELFSGYKKDPKEILKIFNDGACDEMVILKDIEFYSTCEHHMLPFYGSISIGYIPNGKVIGVSKLARLVEIYSRRLQIQERMTSQIADALNSALEPKGVMVVCKAKHLCMIARGIQKQNSEMVTSSITGVFQEDHKAREEFLQLCQK